jgi:deoxyribonuclease-4
MHLALRDGVQRAREIGCQALQVFCGNPRAWRAPRLEPAFAAAFRSELAAAGIEPLIVHAMYLINLAAPNERLYAASREAMIAELQRAVELGARYYVVHTGHHMGSGARAGRQRVAGCVREALSAVPNAPMVLLENTAGGGSSLGTSFEELAAMIEECADERVGVCLDTCHALAAGYEIRTRDGVAATLDELARTVGLERLRCLHVNDSKGELGSHRDRHEQIGRGCIGADGFRAFFSDQRLWNLPAILETPRPKPKDDLDNLWRAIGIAVEAGAVRAAEVGRRPRDATGRKPIGKAGTRR